MENNLGSLAFLNDAFETRPTILKESVDGVINSLMNKEPGTVYVPLLRFCVFRSTLMCLSSQ